MIKTLFTPLLFLFFTLPSFAQSPTAKEDLRPQEIKEEEATSQLKDVQSDTESSLDKQEKLVKDAQSQAKKSKSVTERALAEYLTAIQKYRAELSETKLGRIKDINLTIKTMRDKSEALKQIELKSNKSRSDLAVADLDQATRIWREIVDLKLSSLFETVSVKISHQPEIPPGVSLDGDKLVTLKKEIISALTEVESERTQLKSDVLNLLRSEKNVSSGLLLNAGRIRANLMNVLIDRNKYSPWSLSTNDLRDYLREFKIVPYRFIATFTQKYFEFDSLSQEGVKGWADILKQLFLLFFVFALPFIVFKFFRKISFFLENTRKQVFTSSQMNYKNRTRIALWIGLINPYLPWVFAFSAIKFAGTLLKGTFLAPLTLVLPYFNLYVVYRIFRIGFSSILARILLSKSLDAVRKKQSRVESTAQKLSVLLFVELALLYATQDAVRKALIYNMIFDVVVVLNLVVLAFEARSWKSELLALTQTWLKSEWIDKVSQTNNIVIESIVYPILFAANAVYLALIWAYNWIGQFDIGKQLSSEIFRKRLEEAAEENGAVAKLVPENYSQLFLAEGVSKNTRVLLSKTPLKKCVSIIEKWEEGTSSEDLLLLYGNFGIGKSTIVTALKDELQAKMKVQTIQIENTVTSPSDFYSILSKLFGTKVESAKDLENLDTGMEKTLLIIDDIQKLFLNEPNGLGAYRTLINLTSLQLENIFWCLTCNGRSLAHLKGIFGQNHLQGEHIELLSWSDAEIQDLILKRHSQSEMKLKFDKIISAVHRGDILESSAGLEVQFFRMLWGQSRGNPRTAQELWLTATNLLGKNEIRVSVPDFTNAKDLNNFSDETLMLFANIVKQENLTYLELKRVSNLMPSAIKQSIKLGEDGGVLQRMGPQRWRIHPKAQYVVHAQLSGRNLIYG